MKFYKIGMAASVAAVMISGCGKLAAESQAGALPARPTPKEHKLPAQLVDADAPQKSSGVQLTGRSQAHEDSTVSPAAVGVVTEVNFKLGDHVKKGQVLASIDARMPRLQVYQASAAVKLAEAQAAGARRESRRLAAALKNKAVPQVNADMAQTQAEAADAQVEVAKAALAQARQHLRDMQVRAPFDGQITARMIDPGERINGVSISIIARLQRTDPLDVVLDAPAELLTKLKIGDAVHLRFPSTKQEAEAKIARIVRAVSPRSGSFQVIAELDNPEGDFVAGSFVEGTIPSLAPEGAAK